MKQLYIMLMMVIGLSACSSTPQDLYTQSEVDELIADLQAQLDNQYTNDEIDLKFEQLNFYSQDDLDMKIQAIYDVLNLQYTSEELDLAFNNLDEFMLLVETAVAELNFTNNLQETDIDELYAYVDELEQILINLEVIEGLNGQRE